VAARSSVSRVVLSPDAAAALALARCIALTVFAVSTTAKGFEVSNTGYWVYVTATQKQGTFENALHFESNLVSYQANAGWIDGMLEDIFMSLNEQILPGPGSECDLCAYFDKRATETAELDDLIWPFCDKCDKRMSRALYGLPSGPPPAGYVSMGCVVDPFSPEFICNSCDNQEDQD
jgi:hypothetical protein